MQLATSAIMRETRAVSDTRRLESASPRQAFTPVVALYLLATTLAKIRATERSSRAATWFRSLRHFLRRPERAGLGAERDRLERRVSPARKTRFSRRGMHFPIAMEGALS